MPFLVIQLPAFFAPSTETVAAGVGAVLCLALFCWYLYDSYVQSSGEGSTAEAKRVAVLAERVLRKELSISAAVYHEISGDGGEAASEEASLVGGGTISARGRSRVSLTVA